MLSNLVGCLFGDTVDSAHGGLQLLELGLELGPVHAERVREGMQPLPGPRAHTLWRWARRLGLRPPRRIRRSNSKYVTVCPFGKTSSGIASPWSCTSEPHGTGAADRHWP